VVPRVKLTEQPAYDYQVLRKPRADWAVRTAAANGKGLHMGAGQDRDARNAAFQAAMTGAAPNPDKAIDK
jgi:salicylate hydroxylase